MKSILLDLLMNIINIFLLYVIVRGLSINRSKILENRKAKSQPSMKQPIGFIPKLSSSRRIMRASSPRRSHSQGNHQEERGRRESQGERNCRKRQNDAKKLIDNAEKDIASKKHDMIEAIKGDVVDLSLSIASKVIGKNLSDEDNRRIAEEFLKMNLRISVEEAE